MKHNVIPEDINEHFNDVDSNLADSTTDEIADKISTSNSLDGLRTDGTYSPFKKLAIIISPLYSQTCCYRRFFMSQAGHIRMATPTGDVVTSANETSIDFETIISVLNTSPHFYVQSEKALQSNLALCNETLIPYLEGLHFLELCLVDDYVNGVVVLSDIDMDLIQDAMTALSHIDLTKLADVDAKLPEGSIVTQTITMKDYSLEYTEGRLICKSDKIHVSGEIVRWCIRVAEDMYHLLHVIKSTN